MPGVTYHQSLGKHWTELHQQSSIAAANVGKLHHASRVVGIEVAPVELGSEQVNWQLNWPTIQWQFYLVGTDRVVKTVVSYGVAVSSLTVKFLFGQLRDSLRISVRIISVGSLNTLRHFSSERFILSTLAQILR